MQEPMTLQEIAKEMGMTHQAITNILNNAMRLMEIVQMAWLEMTVA